MILKKNNIAEYILYLWQIEDYLRAFPQQAEANQELHDLSDMMHQEDIMTSGHLQLAQNANYATQSAKTSDFNGNSASTKASYTSATILEQNI